MTDAASPSWPRQLEQWRLDDDATQSAYDSVAVPMRQALKNGIAAAFWHLRRQTGISSRCLRDAASGFAAQGLDYPADWAMLLVGSDFNAPARLAAAALLPRIAGVETVGAIFSDDSPQKGMLLALALSGCEDVFCAPPACLQGRLPMPGGSGVIFILHGGSLGGAATVARESGIDCLEESRPPRLRVEDPGLVDRQRLIFCHGEAGRLAFDSPAPHSACDACFGMRAFREPCLDSPRLCLGSGLEGFWLHECATPDSFRLRRLALARLEAVSVFPDFPDAQAAGPNDLGQTKG